MSGTTHPVWGALPWHADGSAVYTRNGDVVAEVAYQAGGDPAASMAREQSIARLLAAAPALAEALRAILELDDGDNPALWPLAEEFDNARAAMALIESPPAVEVIEGEHFDIGGAA